MLLPHKLSALLDTAVDAAKKVTKLPNVTYDVFEYLENDPPNKSSTVGLAGCVMLKYRLVTTPIPNENADFWPGDCVGNEKQLDAIDHMDGGYFRHAYISLHGDDPKGDDLANLERVESLVDEFASKYHFVEGPDTKWWGFLEKCADVLREGGL